MLRGADLFKRFVQSPARRVIKYAFEKHLFATNVTISLTLSGVGDVLQQHHNIIQQQQHSWDRARTRHMTCTGVTVGALCHHWYVLLDRRLPGRSLAVVLKKLLVDQLLFSPVCLTVFFLSLGLFQGGDWSTFVSDVRHKSWRLYAAEWLVWPPAQLVNFYLLPTKFRVLYDNSISLMFDIYTSHVCYDKKIVEDN
ncbi:mpv17-like protein 2 isoform X2 [Portunus trituberculatus]|nr:mpv17-like protein 2 isoform X2 [Portunus trituberculatus]